MVSLLPLNKNPDSLNRTEGMSVLAIEYAEDGMVVPKMVDEVRPGTLATHGLHLSGCFPVTLPGLLFRNLMKVRKKDSISWVLLIMVHIISFPDCGNSNKTP